MKFYDPKIVRASVHSSMPYIDEPVPSSALLPGPLSLLSEPAQRPLQIQSSVSGSHLCACSSSSGRQSLPTQLKEEAPVLELAFRARNHKKV